MDRERYQPDDALMHLAIAWDVIVGIATVQAILFFGMPFDVLGSDVDMRFMLGFAACGVLGAILLTIAARGRISAVWAIIPFVPPGLLSLYWGQMLLYQEISLALIGMLGLPVLAYAGGCLVSIYVSTRQQRAYVPRHAKKS